MQLIDLAVVELREIGVEPGGRRWCRVDLVLQDSFLGFHLFQLGLETRGAKAVGDRVVKSEQAVIQLGQLALLAGEVVFQDAVLLVDLRMERPDELLDHVGLHELLLEAVEDRFLAILPPNAPRVVAGSGTPCSAAGQVVLADADERAAAGAAVEKAGEQVPRTAMLPEPRLARPPHRR